MQQEHREGLTMTGMDRVDSPLMRQERCLRLIKVLRSAGLRCSQHVLASGLCVFPSILGAEDQEQGGEGFSYLFGVRALLGCLPEILVLSPVG